jgi:DNA-binding NarL/FixJ family response regulator
MAFVLCTGIDPVLMHTRQLILEKAGHTVIGVLDEHKLRQACAAHNFDVAVIGQTVSRQTKERVLRLIRENCPSAKILELHMEYEGRVLQEADAALPVPIDVPQQLAEVVATLAGE